MENITTDGADYFGLLAKEKGNSQCQSVISRAADHHLILARIYGTITNSTEDSEAEAAEGNEAEREEESSQERIEARP